MKLEKIYFAVVNDGTVKFASVDRAKADEMAAKCEAEGLRVCVFWETVASCGKAMDDALHELVVCHDDALGDMACTMKAQALRLGDLLDQGRWQEVENLAFDIQKMAEQMEPMQCRINHLESLLEFVRSNWNNPDLVYHG